MVDKGRSGGRITVILVLTHTKYFIPSLLGFLFIVCCCWEKYFFGELGLWHSSVSIFVLNGWIEFLTYVRCSELNWCDDCILFCTYDGIIRWSLRRHNIYFLSPDPILWASSIFVLLCSSFCMLYLGVILIACHQLVALKKESPAYHLTKIR